MKKKTLEAARIVYDALCIKSNCWQKKIVPAKYIVAIDDDATSAIAAVQLYYKVKQVHGYSPQIICVGGKGLMSRYSHNKSEAELLAMVCNRLGVPSDNVIILKDGRNTGENVLAVAEFVKNNAEGAPVIWAVTKRYSLRLERTQAKQAPELNSFYYVIEETLEEACKLFNGKSLGRGSMMAHELASTLDRCEAYAGTLQEPLQFEIREEVREAARYLEKRYRLKLSLTWWQMPRALVQFVYLFICLKCNKKAMMYDWI